MKRMMRIVKNKKKRRKKMKIMGKKRKKYIHLSNYFGKKTVIHPSNMDILFLLPPLIVIYFCLFFVVFFSCSFSIFSHHVFTFFFLPSIYFFLFFLIFYSFNLDFFINPSKGTSTKKTILLIN